MANSHQFRNLVFLCTLLALLPPYQAVAQPAPGAEFKIGGSLLHFDYREINDNDKELDREEGFIPGVALGMSKAVKQWVFAGDFAYHGGDVAYTGNTNTGIPITTTTRQNIANITLRAEYWFAFDNIPDFAAYVGAGQHQWQRDIRSTTTASGAPVSGLFETYSWRTIFLGVKTELYHSNSDNLFVDIRLVQTRSPRINVQFNNTYDNAILDLGERRGYKVALPWHHAVDVSTRLVVEPYFESYEFGRSESAPLTSNGSVVGSVFEPYSQTSNYGLTVGISQAF